MSMTSTRPQYDVTNTETFIELIANVGHQTMIQHNIYYTLYIILNKCTDTCDAELRFGYLAVMVS